MQPSASLGIPQQEHAAGQRPASATVQSVPPPAQSSSRRQQRGVSHQVVSQQSHHTHQSSPHDLMPYPDVYSHPAALAYAAAHPRRTIPKFGPYLLLQTLGEGEFGKVKLGLHCQWGEEVAVKLIRRGNIDSTVRMSKVEREIEVLRTLKHPNIVRLYDVIETDKYIGIILEYASGGELFDHILAHRYLKERDAAKLFSQLISGVWYIHQKKIVHRDLKLENLLLDRNRNVIITDFGFANRFEHRSDDLMQTSCGSPCYAAPELVISEGLYVGSAVDIWSCGVILYAMLAGYLPFDDDPQNPDGDNINLLYKYIVSTELQFPEYIGEEARSLLRMMLVPDPAKRSTLEQVMHHPWLAPYATPKDGPPAIGVPHAFGRGVEQLECMAMEQHHQKRLAYQKQMKAAAMAAAGHQQPPVNRSQSQYATTSTTSRHQLAATDGGGRSTSVQPEYLYDSNVDLSSPLSSPPAPILASSSKPAYSSSVGVDDDPFGPPPTTSMKPAPRNADGAAGSSSSGQPPKTHKTSGSNSSSGYRHTIQVEYDEPRGHQNRRSEDRENRSRPQLTLEELSTSRHSHSASQSSVVASSSKERRASQSGPANGSIKPLPTPPVVAVVQTMTSSGPTPTPRDNGSSTSSTPSKAAAVNVASNTPSKTRVTSGSYSYTPTHGTPNTASPPRGLPATPQISVNAAGPLNTPLPGGVVENGNVTRQTSKGHQTGSSPDKLGLGNVPGASTTANSDAQDSTDPSGRVPSESGRSDSSVRFSPATSTYEPSEKGAEKEKDKKGEKEKTSRRNTLTVMVEPFRSVRNRSGKKSSAAPTTPSSTHLEVGNIANAPIEKATKSAGLPPTMPNKSDADTLPSFVGPETGPAMSASTSKAKKVMAWFRSKSKAKDVADDVDSLHENKEKGLFVPASSTQPSEHPAVVVTTPTSSSTPRPPSFTTKFIGAQRSPSTSAVESPSHGSSGLVSRFRNTLTVGYSNQPSPSPKGTAINHPYGAMQTHQGAVDQANITTKPPAEVIKHVRAVLESIGVEIQLETEYKFRCVRPKRRKGSIIVGNTTSGHSASNVSPNPAGGPSAGNSPTLAAVTVVGSAASNGVDKRGLPLPSPSPFSGSGGMLRGLLMRRQSSQVSGGGGASGTYDEDPAIATEPSSGHEALYGDPSQDAGAEVRFSVELTRIVGLNDTFSLDIRRLKGNLRSYKFVYEGVRERVNLQG